MKWILTINALVDGRLTTFECTVTDKPVELARFFVRNEYVSDVTLSVDSNGKRENLYLFSEEKEYILAT